MQKAPSIETQKRMYDFFLKTSAPKLVQIEKLAAAISNLAKNGDEYK